MSAAEAGSATRSLAPAVRRAAASPACRELLAVAVALLAVALVLWPLAFSAELPKATDTDAQYGPTAAFLKERLAHGDLPLWAPGAFGGQPFVGDPQSGVLYPPTLIALSLLGVADALRAVALFHYALAALAAFALVRLLGGTRVGAVYAAVAFAASGHLLARAGALGLLGGAAWLAACVAAAELVVHARGRRVAATAVLAVTLAFTILSGSQQLSAFAALACGLWLLLRLGPRGALFATGAAGGAVALAAVALLPRLQMLHHSTSSEGVADPDGIGRLVWDDVRALAGPFGPGRSEIATLYAGAVTPALAIVAVVRRVPGAAALLALGALAVVWGSGLAGWLLAPVPLLDSLASHEPVRAMALAVLVLAVLAGLAVSLARTGPLVVGGLALLVGLAVAQGVALEPAFVLPVAATAAIAALWRRPRLATVAGIGLVAVLTLDLAWHGRHQDPVHEGRLDYQPDAAFAPPPSGSAAFLLDRQARDGPFRIASTGNQFILEHQLGAARRPSHRNLLLDQEAMRVGLEDVAGYSPIHLDAYSRYLAASNGRPAISRHLELALRAPTPELRALGVRYYVSPRGDAPAGLPVVYRDARAVVTRDPAALPLARVERPGAAPLAADVVRREPDRVTVETPASSPGGRLVLADVDYPGWRVTIDGRGADASVADGLFRAVAVGPGRHVVDWRFEPRVLRLGLLVTLLALVAACGLAAWSLRGSRST